MPSVTILMPALNEEKAIAKAIKRVPLDKLPPTEILVIDGGSTDKTVEIARRYGARVITCDKGYGRQYKYGFKHARGDIIITGDSDASYPFEYAPFLFTFLQKHNLEFITTIRKPTRGSMSFLHKIGNVFLTKTVQFLFKLDLPDSQSGMWCIRKTALPKLNLTSNGMPFSEEIKIEALTKLKWAQVPIPYYPRIGKKKLKTVRDGMKNLWFLVKKRFSLHNRQ